MVLIVYALPTIQIPLYVLQVTSWSEQGIKKGQHEGGSAWLAHTTIHGVILAMTHMHDWIILFILFGLMIALGVMRPFYRFVGKDMMDGLKYPYKSSTVPFWAVSIVAVLLPIEIFVAVYFRRRDVYDLHHAVLVCCEKESRRDLGMQGLWKGQGWRCLYFDTANAVTVRSTMRRLREQTES